MSFKDGASTLCFAILILLSLIDSLPVLSEDRYAHAGNKIHDAESTGPCVQRMSNKSEQRVDLLFWKDVGNGILLDHPLPFELQQRYRPLRRFIREFNPALQEIWSGPANTDL